jgi:2,4-dienoyl-CoA reductase-like NADH-dependent reductase (Old Yellow Enzyme family)/thioredoxin reductase
MKQHQQLTRVFEPIRIGGLALRNRLVMLPMETNYAGPDGSVTERLIAYYSARARDVGLVLVQITCIESTGGKAYEQQLCIDDDRLLPGLSELSAALNAQGARAIIQLHHAGAAALGGQPVAASAIPLPKKPTPRALYIPEVGELIGRYAQAAARAQKAGFDGVEIVASGGYLVWSFLTPTTNTRTDEYGGDLSGRSRLLIEIIKAVRAQVGADYPITCRLAIREYGASPGFTVREAVQVLQMAEKAGLDGVTTTAIGGESVAPRLPGALLPLSRAIKQAVPLPVTAAGRMSLQLAEQALSAGKADLVGFGRRLLADPEYLAKAASDRDDDIRPCIACKECIHTSLVKNQPLRCTVNPSCGHESEHVLGKATQPKRVMVVGGGPAGMQAAITAARRGHHVTLHERSPELGGQLNLAAIPPHKENIAAFTDYLRRQVANTGVTVELDQEVTIDAVEAANPDVVIVATGIEPVIPQIPGMERMHTVMADDVLAGLTEVGCEVVVVGGELIGCETAELLVDSGVIVTVVETKDAFLTKANPLAAMRLLARLRDKGVTLLCGVTDERFEESALKLTTREGERRVIEVNTVVIAAGARPSRALVASIESVVPDTYTVGDCVEPRSIMEATTEGCNVGRRI